MTRRKYRLAAAAATAFSVAILGLGAPLAHADVTTATINPAADTSLTIHKYSGPANTSTECAPTGQPVPATCLTGKTPLPGAEFTLYKVMDLATNADWDAAKDITTFNVADAMGTPVVVTTGPNGTITAEGLDVALYYVVETKSPAGYTGAVPFFITLPMTDATDSAWDYDLDVYPKNQPVEAPHKAVKDVDTYKIGDPIDYNVSATIPTYQDVVGAPAGTPPRYTAPDGVVNRHDVGSYYLWDKFAAELTVDPATVVERVYILPAGIDPTTYDTTTGTQHTLIPAADYQVATAAGIGGGTVVEIGLLGNALDLLAANPGAQIVVDYTTTLNAVPDSGEIENQAFTIPGRTPSQGGTPPTPPSDDTPDYPEDPENPGNPDDPDSPDNPGTPTNTVESRFGQIAIHKIGSDDNAPKVATFEVYYAAVSGTSPNFTYSCAAADIATQTAITEFTTGSDGNGISDMLRLSNWYNDGVEQSDTGNNDGYLDGRQYADKYGWRNYCLVETVAPDGYQLLAEPVLFSLTQQGTVTTVTPTDVNTIVNQPDNLDNELPLTGGEGIAALSIGGLVLIGGGLAYYIVSSRRRQQA